MTSRDCCEREHPPLDLTRQEGTQWRCPECDATWTWTIEEAEGAWWELTSDEFDGAGCCPEEDGYLRARAARKRTTGVSDA